MVSEKPYLAFQLLLRVLAYLLSFIGDLVTNFGVSLDDTPVLFTFTHFPEGKMLPNLRKQWTYSQFVARLKQSCKRIGLDPTLFASHSMRRGSNSDNVAHGVPDTINMADGRWKTFSAYVGYIRDEVQLARRAEFLRQHRA